ncbi:TPA: cysteine hydrolase [Providencia rettgeri]|uniref:cysteine hydrolase family protein n=1 Tax=Providencia TaxID=586 RepID=UPI001B9F2FEB|nr:MULTISPECIES: isochorismatase family cysteine hydrolase [Providencia]EMB5784615.1 cysteine hydrolase [Providencia rettgeri]MDK7743328.1 isochorismatase family cysteine hydrolase [Providencia rettgeri]MDK7756170.1 isochorismatase family cysteine hydrolase [Providencia rettgeri]HBC7427842.1 cysteine hydrolase [Providencia rettgeri]
MSKALVIIDLIEEIIGKNGLSNSSYQQTCSRKIVEKANQAAQYARSHHIPVIWVKVGFSDNYHDVPAGSPMFQQAKSLGALKLSGNGCNWAHDLEVAFRDPVMIKKGVSAFAGNHFHKWLTENGITKLFIGGVSTVKAIESTARQAHDLGYYVTVLEDLCAAPTPELHQQSIQALDGMVTVSSVKEFMQLK